MPVRLPCKVPHQLHGADGTLDLSVVLSAETSALMVQRCTLAMQNQGDA